MKNIDFSKPIVTAHRGAKGLVEHENTLDSFEKAIEIGADSIECDVRKTSDGIIIINHNEDIEGLIIKDHTYAEICEATLAKGYKQPTLIEGLECVKGRMLIDIEIKEEGYVTEILEQILSVLTVNEFWIRSFFDGVIKEVKDINPNITTILLIGIEHVKYGIFSRFNEFFPGKRCKACNCDHVSPYYQLCILGYFKRMHRKGHKVFVWTVDDKPRMEKLLKKGCDGIVTNRPDIALEVLGRK